MGKWMPEQPNSWHWVWMKLLLIPWFMWIFFRISYVHIQNCKTTTCSIYFCHKFKAIKLKMCKSMKYILWIGLQTTWWPKNSILVSYDNQMTLLVIGLFVGNKIEWEFAVCLVLHIFVFFSLYLWKLVYNR